MTVEEAYAAPVTRKRRRDRAFVVGFVVGIAAGAVAVWLLNRAADADEFVDDEPVVELQPAFASDSSSTSRTVPVVPLGNASGANGTQDGTPSGVQASAAADREGLA